MNVLILYNETQTFTSTVYEHLESFARYSRSRVFFAHQDTLRNTATDLHLFDVVVVHYSIRLPFDQIAEATAQSLVDFGGLKVLFIQDEYDFTHRAWHWMKRLGVRLVFSSVPTPSIPQVYPTSEFDDVRFVNNLTGYVPSALSSLPASVPPSARTVAVGYRGRPLPIRYGLLCQQKTLVAQMVRAYCASKGISHDIDWKEEARLYGARWHEFIASCRAMLGTESGSNVFDWDGSLVTRIAAHREANPDATDADVYAAVISAAETPGLMNQVSPRIFEAIACRTALILVEGSYSGIVSPDRHFIPLKADGSNLDEVFERVADGRALDEMTDRAYQEVIAPGTHSYSTFVAMVDDQIERRVRELGTRAAAVPWTSYSPCHAGMSVVTRPVRWQLAAPPPVPERAVRSALQLLPTGLKARLKSVARRLID